MKLVRHGTMRCVLLTGGSAIKVPTLRFGLWSLAQGILANLSEMDWSDIEGVCPQRRCLLGGLIAVYPRCEPYSGPEREHDDPWWRSIAPGVVGVDPKNTNVGVLNGQVVWLDYASPWNGCPHTKEQR